VRADRCTRQLVVGPLHANDQHLIRSSVPGLRSGAKSPAARSIFRIAGGFSRRVPRVNRRVLREVVVATLGSLPGASHAQLGGQGAGGWRRTPLAEQNWIS
jgi:hypothetical protein